MDGINETLTIPQIREYLSRYFLHESNIILEYLVHFPICNIKTISNDPKFISKTIIDHQLCKYFYDKRQEPVTFKFDLKHVSLHKNYEFQILHMMDNYAVFPESLFEKGIDVYNFFGGKLAFIYQFKPKPINLDTIPKIITRSKYDVHVVLHECGHEHKFLIPRDDIFNVFIKFLTSSKEELKSTLFKKDDDFYSNSMYYGKTNYKSSYWRFKLWIIEFLNDISVFLLYKMYKKDLPICDDLVEYYLPADSRHYINWDNFKPTHPWRSCGVLDRSYSFTIIYQGKPRKYYFAIYNIDNLKSKVYYYYVDIRNFEPNKEVLYHRGSTIGKNPITFIVFFLLSRTDEWLNAKYPYIGAEVFRCILLQHIHHIHDWI